MEKGDGRGRKSGARGKYEITMYKLLVLFMLSIFVAIGIGGYFGSKIGYSDAVNELGMPDYCSVQRSGSGPAEVVCAELENLTASEMCELFSTPVKNKIKVMIVR